MSITSKELIAVAEKARLASYSPYSNFAVGAALLCADGTVYTGCNIENASYTPTCCAERVAVFKAVNDGERELLAIAVTAAPCGACRQVLSEFSDGSLEIITEDMGEVATHRLDELLPYSFKLTER